MLDILQNLKSAWYPLEKKLCVRARVCVCVVWCLCVVCVYMYVRMCGMCLWCVCVCVCFHMWESVLSFNHVNSKC